MSNSETQNAMRKLLSIILIVLTFQCTYHTIWAQCETPAVFDNYNTCANPRASVIIRAQTIDQTCGGQTISHKWYTSPTGSNFILGVKDVFLGTCAIYQTSMTVNETTNYWVSAVINGCESSRVKITGTVSFGYTPSLKLSPSTSFDGSTFSGADVCSKNGIASVTLQASGGYIGTDPPATSVYEWYDSPTAGNLLATGPDFSTSISIGTTVGGLKTFYVGGVLMDNLGCSYPILSRKAITIKLIDYSVCLNNVDKLVPQVPSLTSYSSLLLSSHPDVLKSSVFYDGLGRTIQSVSRKASPTGNDIVQPVSYDGFGREFRKYLPVTLPTENDGGYRVGIIDANGNFAGAALNYYNNPADKIKPAKSKD
jgi:hypothetical protein